MPHAAADTLGAFAPLDTHLPAERRASSEILRLTLGGLPCL